MATLMELAFERAMTTSIYQALGVTVTYTSAVADAAEIECVPADASEFFATELGAQTQRRIQTARVQKSDVEKPYRGDTITNADGKVYTVTDYAQENAMEWNLTLRVCDDG